MKARTHTRWGKRVALGLAVAAITAPAAQGAYEPLYQHQFLSDGTVVEPLLPSIDEMQQFRFTPGEATPPFSFTPSNEPVGPTVVIPDPTRGLPSADEIAAVPVHAQSDRDAGRVHSIGRYRLDGRRHRRRNGARGAPPRSCRGPGPAPPPAGPLLADETRLPLHREKRRPAGAPPPAALQRMCHEATITHERRDRSAARDGSGRLPDRVGARPGRHGRRLPRDRPAAGARGWR